MERMMWESAEGQGGPFLPRGDFAHSIQELWALGPPGDHYMG